MKGRDVLIIISFIAIIVVLGIIFFTLNSKTKDIGGIFGGGKPDTGEKEISSSSSSSSSFSSGGSSSSSSSSGSESSPSSSNEETQDCETKQITYSIVNIEKNETCQNYVGETCTSKFIHCSAIIENRDATGGGFSVEILFVEDKKSREEYFESETRNFFVEAGGKYKFEKETLIESSGEDDLANQIINCYYNTLIIPEKEICM